MQEKIKKFWTSLDRTISVNKRELVLGVAASALAGVVLGVFLSPRKTTTIGSNNGSNNSGNNALVPAKPGEDAQPEENGD